MKVCLDCGVPVSKPHVDRCRTCHGLQMRVRHRVKRALRARLFSVNAKAARRLVKRMNEQKGVVCGS